MDVEEFSYNMGSVSLHVSLVGNHLETTWWWWLGGGGGGVVPQFVNIEMGCCIMSSDLKLCIFYKSCFFALFY